MNVFKSARQKEQELLDLERQRNEHAKAHQEMIDEAHEKFKTDEEFRIKVYHKYLQDTGNLNRYMPTGRITKEEWQIDYMANVVRQREWERENKDNLDMLERIYKGGVE